MAELQLIVGGGLDPRNYMDGDILQGFNDRKIGWKNAECVCCGINGHPKPQRSRDGLLAHDTITETYYLTTHQYRFRRVLDVVERTELKTGDKELFGSTPNQRGEYVHVRQDIAIRKQVGFPLFGSDGQEVWYGGRKDYTPANINKLWQEIEARSSHRRADHTRWPIGTEERKLFLSLPVDDFDDATARAMCAVQTEEIPDPHKPGRMTTRIVKKRTMQVPYPLLDLSPATLAQVRDNRVGIDIRDREPFARSQVVQAR